MLNNRLSLCIYFVVKFCKIEATGEVIYEMKTLKSIAFWHGSILSQNAANRCIPQDGFRIVEVKLIVSRCAPLYIIKCVRRGTPLDDFL
jgi:hypothetical protein